MSTLQIANLHFEATGNNRIQYTGTNTFVFVAAGANLMTVNTSSISFSNTNLSIANITSSTNTFTIGTAAYHVANGNFGIGNSTPAAVLSITAPNNSVSPLYIGNTTTQFFALYSDGSTFHDGTQRVRKQGNTRFRSDRYINDQGAQLNAYDDTGNTFIPHNYQASYHYFTSGNTGNISTLFLSPTGNVGIGTTSPGYKLDLVSDTVTFPVRIYNSNTTTASAVNADNFLLLQNYYGITQISNWQNLGMRIGSRQIQNGGNGHIYFTVAGDSVHSFMAANGNMGVGTTTPSQHLSVKQSFSVTDSGGIQYILMGNQDSAGTNAPSVIRAANKNIEFGFGDSWSNSIGGNFTGTFGIMNPAGTLYLKGGNVNAGGTGITFPATVSVSTDANTLDDYEEGTWSPGLAFGGTGTTGMSIGSSGSYTKIGRLVTCHFSINVTTKGSSTGAAWITGLPFTTNGGHRGGGSMTYAVGFSTLNNPGQFQLLMESDGTSFILRYFNGNTYTSNDLDNSHFANGTQFWGQFSYSTTS